MSRTYRRNHYIETQYHNIEGYERYVNNQNNRYKLLSAKYKRYDLLAREAPFTTKEAHEYFKMTRDKSGFGSGRNGYSSANRSYKIDAKEKLRLKNKRDCKKLLTDVEYWYNMPEIYEKDTKPGIWFYY